MFWFCFWCGYGFIFDRNVTDDIGNDSWTWSMYRKGDHETLILSWIIWSFFFDQSIFVFQYEVSQAYANASYPPSIAEISCQSCSVYLLLRNPINKSILQSQKCHKFFIILTSGWLNVYLIMVNVRVIWFLYEDSFSMLVRIDSSTKI